MPLQPHQWIQQIQQDHIDHKEEVSSKTFTGQHWLQKVPIPLWAHLYMAWKVCNTNLHGIDVPGQETKRKSQAETRHFSSLQDCRQARPPDYKRLFNLLSLLEQLQLKSHKQTAWIGIDTLAIR